MIIELLHDELDDHLLDKVIVKSIFEQYVLQTIDGQQRVRPKNVVQKEMKNYNNRVSYSMTIWLVIY